jgi:predicted membrane channel-forming protein YqfA (hemolysin III family)
VLDQLFDIKNDRRLSMYLYRLGFGMWLLYLVLGAPAMHAYVHYRTDVGVSCFVLMVFGLSASMVYDYFHQREAYEQKKKWLFVSYIGLAMMIYFLEFNGKDNIFDFTWLLRLF